MDLAYVKGDLDSYNIYVKSIFAFLFYFVMSVLIRMLHSQIRSAVGEVLLWSFILGMAGCHAFMLYKIAPRIELDSECIIYNSKKFYWTELETFSFSGKYKVFFADIKEGMMLKFRGQKELYIFDDAFANISDIKQFIRENVIEKEVSPISAEEILPVGRMDKLVDRTATVDKESWEEHPADALQPLSTADSSIETFIKYNNSQFFSQRGYLIWLFPAIFFIALFQTTSLTRAILLLSFIIGWVEGWSTTVYYFKLSEKSLVIQNCNLFWFKRTYALSDIREIVFEQKYSKSPNTLRVTLKDFTSDTYQAGTLWTKTWFKLKDDLEQKGVKVRNDSVIELFPK